MRILIVALLITYTFPLASFGQKGIGIDFGFASEKAMLIGIKYFNHKNSFLLGYTRQLSDTKGKRVANRSTNYGNSTSGSGDYFWMLDLGYGRSLTKKMSILGEVSLGANNTYQNYSDRRFSGGGYHTIIYSKLKFGLGGQVVYGLGRSFAVSGGYNSVRGISLGIEFKLVGGQD